MRFIKYRFLAVRVDGRGRWHFLGTWESHFSPEKIFQKVNLLPPTPFCSRSIGIGGKHDVPHVPMQVVQERQVLRKARWMIKRTKIRSHLGEGNNICNSQQFTVPKYTLRLCQYLPQRYNLFTIIIHSPLFYIYFLFYFPSISICSHTLYTH